MNSLLNRLSEEDLRELREWTAIAEDIDWPAYVARDHGWLAANASYHKLQMQIGCREMEALMAMLQVTTPVDQTMAEELAEELLVAATELCMNTPTMRVVSRMKEGELRLYSTHCPLYDRFVDPRWHGLTACGCFFRRRGWYAALQGVLGEELRKSRKWGDPVCEVAVLSTVK